VVEAARAWVRRLRVEHPEVRRVGYFGSYARGDYVPGSDFDVLIEVAHSDVPRWRDRGPAFYPSGFPVGVELFVYTSDELTRLRADRDPFIRAVDADSTWLDDPL
jgi:predicted nucleotidyltransferase